jgi:hypothetical protein
LCCSVSPGDFCSKHPRNRRILKVNRSDKFQVVERRWLSLRHEAWERRKRNMT